MFLRINSEPAYPPHMIIRGDGADFLDADSYVELWQLVRHFELEIQQADELGRLTRTHVQALRIAIAACDALPQDLKDFVMENLDRYQL